MFSVRINATYVSAQQPNSLRTQFIEVHIGDKPSINCVRNELGCCADTGRVWIFSGEFFMFSVFADDVSSTQFEERGVIPGLRESGPE